MMPVPSYMQVFLNVWLAAPQAQGSLRKVLNTWKDIFPEAMLAAVARQIGSPAVGIPPLHMSLSEMILASPEQAVRITHVAGFGLRNASCQGSACL